MLGVVYVMKVQQIGAGVLALEFEASELSGEGMSPQSVNGEQALTLLRRVLPDNEVLEGAELEVFCGRNSLLLFAKLCVGAPLFFEFQSFEDLLAAAFEMPDNTVSSLIRFAGRYILVIKIKDRQRIPAALWEFGKGLAFPQYAELHLREHGTELIPYFAVSFLKEAFYS